MSSSTAALPGCVRAGGSMTKPAKELSGLFCSPAPLKGRLLSDGVGWRCNLTPLQRCSVCKPSVLKVKLFFPIDSRSVQKRPLMPFSTLKSTWDNWCMTGYMWKVFRKSYFQFSNMACSPTYVPILFDVLLKYLINVNLTSSYIAGPQIKRLGFLCRKRLIVKKKYI